MRGQKHSDETKAAVMAALLAGQSVCQVAAEFQIGKATASRWRSEIGSTDLERVGTQKEANLEQHLLDYVSTNLRTLKAQSEIAARPDWVQKQSASELAVFHGVLADKTLRILSALQPEPEPEFIN